ncbi:MAG: TIGR03790 family protein, partial [Patescibacteria group bacterium]
MRGKRSFTLIEILMVVAIIGLLAALILISVTNARAKARDAKVKNDITQTQKALEMYTLDHDGSYPIYDGPLENIPGLSPEYIKTLPKSTNSYAYYYTSSDGKTYSIYAKLEKPPEASKPYLVATPGEIQYISGLGSPYCENIITDQLVKEKETLNFTISNCTNEDGAPVSWLSENIPQGANFDPNSLSFSWTPDYGQQGKHQITISALNGFGKTDRTFNIQVLYASGFSGNNVLIVMNDNSADSQDIGNYYAMRRNIPQENIVHISTNTDEIISMENFNSQIKNPIKIFIDEHNIKNQIYYIVTTYGTPNRILGWQADCEETNNSCMSVDSKLSDLYNDVNNETMGANNPYFIRQLNDPGVTFDKADPTYQNMFLVSRLDGPSTQIAKGLVDKAIYSEYYTGPASGKAYMSGQPFDFDYEIKIQCQIIESAGYTCIKDPFHYNSSGIADYMIANPTFGPRINPLWHAAGHNYYWNYWNSWRPGAVAFNLRSFAAKRSIQRTNLPEPISVPLLLDFDITATSGPVGEPYFQGLPDTKKFFNRFLNGEPSIGRTHFTFAESMFMSTE